MHSSSIELSNGNLTVLKKPETEYGIVAGNMTFNSGKNYFEIKIEKLTQIEDDGDDFLIGVAQKDKFDVSKPYNEGKYLWGYMPLRAEKVGPDLSF